MISIAEIRKNKKMTQQDLAKKAGISRVTLSLLETGKQKGTSTKTILAIAKALGVSVDALFFEE